MSLTPKIDELRIFLQHEKADICCITVTWLKDTIDDNVISIQNYQIVRKDRIYAQHGGVALYVKESIKLDRLRDYEDTSNNHIEVIWCKLRPYRLPRGFSGLIVGILYHPPNSNDDQMKEYLFDTLSKIESSHPNCGILLAGDFNRLDVSQISNCHFRLKQLVNFATRGDNTLDLILTNWSEYYQKPVKFPPFGLSDHCTIKITPKVRSKRENSIKKVFVRDLRLSSKLALARYFTSIDWSTIDIFQSTEEKCQFFNNIIHLGLDTIMPVKSLKIHTQDAPWMTGHLKSLLRKRQKAFSRNCPTFKFYRNRVNRERKRCKSIYYQTKIKDLGVTEPKKWWAECKKICGMSKPTKNIANILLSNNSPSQDHKCNLANEINATFLQPLQEFAPLSQTNRLDVTNFELPQISCERVSELLNQISASKACGPDNIPNWLLKDFSDNLAIPLCKIINSSLAEKQLPNIWKCANVTPIPKNSR